MAFLSVLQIIISILFIIFVLLQQRGTALGSTFGGGGESYGTLRGVQQKLFWGTIALGAVFIILSILNLVL